MSVPETVLRDMGYFTIFQVGEEPIGSADSPSKSHFFQRALEKGIASLIVKLKVQKCFGEPLVDGISCASRKQKAEAKQAGAS